jgi:hypothetical protein
VLLILQLLAWRWLHASTIATARASSPWRLPLLGALLHGWRLVAKASLLLLLLLLLLLGWRYMKRMLRLAPLALLLPLTIARPRWLLQLLLLLLV